MLHCLLATSGASPSRESGAGNSGIISLDRGTVPPNPEFRVVLHDDVIVCFIVILSNIQCSTKELGSVIRW
eukprot:763777-Hanusia_phi.AAC.2